MRRAALSIACVAGLASCRSYLERSQGGRIVAAPGSFDVDGRAGSSADEVGAAGAAERITPPRAYEDSAAVTPSSWGTALGDPALDEILAEAIAVNYEIKAAIERVRQSLAIAHQVRAARYPSVSANAGASYSSFVRPLDARRRLVSQRIQLYRALGAAFDLDDR